MWVSGFDLMYLVIIYHLLLKSNTKPRLRGLNLMYELYLTVAQWFEFFIETIDKHNSRKVCVKSPGSLLTHSV